MAPSVYAWRPPRILSAATSLAVVGLIGLALMLGLRVRQEVHRTPALVAISLSQPRPSPTPTPSSEPPKKPDKPAAPREASPANLRNQATQVVAPPVRPLIEPPPVVTAPVQGIGSAANTGASDRPGLGRGAGGIGDGTGGGGAGGDGAGGVAVVGPRRIRGELGYDDLPKGVLQFGQEASVRVLYTVTPEGSVTNCRAARSSGYGVIDTVACQLIERRFRFRPALDAARRPVRAEVMETHTWVEDGRR